MIQTDQIRVKMPEVSMVFSAYLKFVIRISPGNTVNAGMISEKI
jgi:hypothetical protein